MLMKSQIFVVRILKQQIKPPCTSLKLPDLPGSLDPGRSAKDVLDLDIWNIAVAAEITYTMRSAALPSLLNPHPQREAGTSCSCSSCKHLDIVQHGLRLSWQSQPRERPCAR